MFASFMSIAQESESLKTLRAEFQKVDSEEDIDKILAFNVGSFGQGEQQLVNAYQAAGTCMMANYVFSPKSKLNYFNQGKAQLEDLIEQSKDVEKVYLRLLIQLNVPKILNYHKNIEGDIQYLHDHMAKAQIEDTFKYMMIENLISITKKEEFKKALLDIKVEKEC